MLSLALFFRASLRTLLRSVGVTCIFPILFSPIHLAIGAEYLLGPGDTLELTVMGALRETQRAAVGVDGMVSFPLVGDVHAAGRTLSDVRSQVRDTLTSQPFRRQALDPGPSTYTIAANEISLQIAEFRPVYVSGDVLHPGQVAYRPGLTVRQAVAVAGGFGRDRTEGRRIEVRNRYARAALDFAKFSLQARSLEKELGSNNDKNDSPSFDDVDASAVKAMETEVEERSAARRQTFDARRDFLNVALDHSAHRVKTLESQADIEQKGADLDAAEVVSVDGLFQKGVIPVSRLTDVRRSSLLSSSRALQTKVALEDAKRDFSELQSRVDDLDRERKVQLLTDRETANSNMRSAALEMLGARRELNLEGDATAGVRITIFRKQSDRVHGSVADEDAELDPGDTVEIRLAPQGPATAGADAQAPETATK